MILLLKNASSYVVMERSLILNVMMVIIWMVMDVQEIVRYNQDTNV